MQCASHELHNFCRDAHELIWQRRLQGLISIAEGLPLNSSLRQLKVGNNNCNTLFGFGQAKTIFREKEATTGLKTSFN